MPLYPLYALLFADSGLSESRIAVLFVVWSVVAVVAEIPLGAWADSHSRRLALVMAGLLQAVGYALWIAFPGFAGFLAGFVLWGVGGSLSSGAFQALVHDGLTVTGAPERYASVIGRAEAAAYAVQIPVAAIASALFAAGGYTLAGLVSIGVCLAAAALATTFEDLRPAAVQGTEDDEEPDLGYFAVMRAGLGEAAASPPVRLAAVAVAALTGLDALEEFQPLLAADWGVAVTAVPLALVPLSLAGALGSALAGPGARLSATAWRLILLLAALSMAVAWLVSHPVGLVGVAISYAAFRWASVVADARLQASIEGPARATVTSAATLGTEVVAVALCGLWAVGGLGPVTVVAFAVVLALPARALGRVRVGARA